MLPIFRLNKISHRKSPPPASAGVPLPPLDLTEDNVKQVLTDARIELGQLFDASEGMTGQAELDRPFVKIKGIEDEKQLDGSPENFLRRL